MQFACSPPACIGNHQKNRNSLTRLVTCAESIPASHPVTDGPRTTQVRNMWTERLTFLFPSPICDSTKSGPDE